MTASKMLIFLESMPKDLATHVVLSAISMNTENLAKAVELAAAINALRIAEEAHRLAGEKAEVIVQNTMEEFQSKLKSGIK